MFILYVAEYLLHKIFQSDHAGCAAKLVDNHGKRPFLGKQPTHHLVGHQTLRGKQYGLETLGPIHAGPQEFGHVDVAEHGINIVVIDQNLGTSGGGEQRR